MSGVLPRCETWYVYLDLLTPLQTPYCSISNHKWPLVALVLEWIVKGKARAIPNGDSNEKDFLALDLDGDRGESGMVKGGSDGYQQMQLVEQQVGSAPLLCIQTIHRLCPKPVLLSSMNCRIRGVADLCFSQDNYIQSRSTAIESIESTIAELGSIFSQLAGMVAEQRETVQRIDADTTDIAA